MSDFFELVSNRESCRRYSGRKVSMEMLRKCIETARLAPSACNAQPWHFVVVHDEKTVSEVAKCTQSMGMNKFTAQVPAFIVVLEDKANLTAKLGGAVKNQQYAQIDIGIAAAHICFAAEEQGLSTCILGWFSEKDILKALSLPGSKRIRLVIAVGYAADDSLREKKRKAVDEIADFIE